MKLTVQKDNLLKGLQKVTNIIGSKSTLPVLANVMVEAENDSLTLTTTDLEVRISTKIEAKVSEGGKTTIPAKRLITMVGRFLDEEVSIKCDKKHHSEFVCGSARFKLLGLAADDFPLPVEFTPVRKLKFNEADFSRIVDQISYAVSLEDSRKVLHGILVSVKDKTFTAVATDGKRLALVEKIIDDFSGTDGNVIIPLKTANELKRILEKDEKSEVSIGIGDQQVMFDNGSTVMTSKLIEGNYPNYRQVIPPSFTKTVEIPSGRFIGALELVSIALADSSAVVMLTFADNQLKFQASSTNIGEGNDAMDIEYGDDEVKISFNPGFLADPFRHSDADKMTFKMNDGYSPVAIESGDGFLYVIMPMRNK